MDGGRLRRRLVFGVGLFPRTGIRHDGGKKAGLEAGEIEKLVDEGNGRALSFGARHSYDAEG